MEIRNTIDVQQLKVTPQDADNTYLGIDENGQLVRTKIELNGTGGGDGNFKTIDGESIVGDGDIKIFTNELFLEWMMNRENDSVRIDEITKNKWGLKSGEEVIAGNYGTYTVGDLKTINGESLIGDTDIELLTMSSYNQLKGSIDNHTEKISDIEDDVDEIKNNKWGIRSGDGVIAGNYGTYTVGDLKTINGQSLIGTEDIVIEGGSGGGIEPYIFNIIDTQWEETPDWDALKAVFDSGKPMIMRYITDEGDVNICQVLGWSDTQFWAVGKWAGLSEDRINMYYGYPDRVYSYSKIVLQAELDVELYKITSQIGDINNILESI